MVRIISDTSTLYSSAQAKEAGFDVSPLSVHIGGKSYREFNEISSAEFVSLIHQGHMPTSSQPAIGEVCALYEQYSEEEVLNITMADGLSGTYASAVAAKELCGNSDGITVLNSRTLCGPHRYLVERAVALASAGAGLAQIVAACEALMATEKSYLIPADFGYLRRGGRLSPMVSFVGQAAHLAPILTLTEDARQLKIAGVRRGFSNAIRYVADALTAHGTNENWRLYISHAVARGAAEQARDLLRKAFPSAHIEIHPLSPAFITQGGPGCVAVQAILA